MSAEKKSFWQTFWSGNWNHWQNRLNLIGLLGHLCFVWSKNVWCYCIDVFFIDLILIALGSNIIRVIRDRRALKLYDALHDQTVKKLEELMTTPVTSPLLVESRVEQVEAYILKREKASAEVFKRWGIDK